MRGTPGPRVIYDFGMNNGDDVEYYLLKADRVIAVDANSALCNAVESRFADAIEAGKLTILNVALAEREQPAPVSFYIHKVDHVLSQLPRPSPNEIDSFDETKIDCRTPSSIVRQFGPPLYVKVDVEHFDAQVLRELFASGIHPPEISAESHSVEVFSLLVANGYRSFNLVEGRTIPRVYGNANIVTAKGTRSFRFKSHSAGPFGDDLKSRWEDADTFFYTLAAAGLGWKDIHASMGVRHEGAPSSARLLLRQASGLAGQVTGRLLRRFW